MRERRSGLVFTEHQQLHVLQLANVHHALQDPSEAEVARWARFFVAETEEELDALAEESETMSEAKNALDELSRDRTARWEAEDRDHSIATYRGNLERAREEGIEEGLRRVLRQLLTQRFGELPEWVSRRLDVESVDALDAIALHMTTAKSVEELFPTEK